MLLLALASPELLDVRGISVVAGNVPLELGERNARLIVELADRADVPVFAGSDRSLDQERRPHDARRGETGLDPWPVATPDVPLRPEHAVDALIAAADEVGGEGLTLVATGPLTNAATALRQAPGMARQLCQIAIMGGVFDVRGAAPETEFNIGCDPQAAQILFTCARPLTVFGLDVTLQAVATPERVARIGSIGTEAARAVHAMLSFGDAAGRARYGTDGAPLHDPCPVAWLLRPDLFDGHDTHVTVENDGSVRLDATAAPNARWIDTIDADGYFDLIADSLAR